MQEQAEHRTGKPSSLLNPMLAIVLVPLFALGFSERNRSERQESKLRFQHHYVDADLPRGGPDGKRFNYGQTALTDLDQDGVDGDGDIDIWHSPFQVYLDCLSQEPP
jgi:hypothetical protein